MHFSFPFLQLRGRIRQVILKTLLGRLFLYNEPNTAKEVNEMKGKKNTAFNSGIYFAVMMFISNGIAAVLPIPIPPSVIGLVLLFALLCTKVLKLEQVESLGTALTSLIGFCSFRREYQ